MQFVCLFQQDYAKAKFHERCGAGVTQGAPTVDLVQSFKWVVKILSC